MKQVTLHYVLPLHLLGHGHCQHQPLSVQLLPHLFLLTNLSINEVSVVAPRVLLMVNLPYQQDVGVTWYLLSMGVDYLQWKNLPIRSTA